MPDEPDSQHQRPKGFSRFLERELATFEKNKPRLLWEHEGEFALVKGDVVLGTFDTFEKADDAGLGQFGTDPFLVKQIAPAPRQRWMRTRTRCTRAWAKLSAGR